MYFFVESGSKERARLIRRGLCEEWEDERGKATEEARFSGHPVLPARLEKNSAKVFFRSFGVTFVGAIGRL